MEMSDWQVRKCRDLIRSLKEWGDKPDSYHIAQFLVLEDISFKKLRKLCDMNPHLDHALEVCKSKILVNWMHRFEKEEVSVQTARFGQQCISTYDLDHLDMTKRKNASKFSKKINTVGSKDDILDDQFLGDFKKVKLEGEAQKLYDQSNGRPGEGREPKGSIQPEG